jgi:hypothetical protein
VSAHRASAGRTSSGLRWRSGVLAACAFAASLAGCGNAATSASRSAAADGTYGALPSWLPTATAPVDRVMTASARDPRLGVEGDSMRAVLAEGTTIVTVVGPSVPPFRAPPPPVTTATFTVTMSRTTGTVPILPRDFQLVDGSGAIHDPSAFAGRVPPRVAPRGATVSFTIKERMATGAGSIRWSPDGAPVAAWDFTVEND